MDLKRKLRSLKKLELKIKNLPLSKQNINLVWNIFFNTKDSHSKEAKYNLNYLLSISEEEIKNIFIEFIYEGCSCFSGGTASAWIGNVQYTIDRTGKQISSKRILS